MVMNISNLIDTNLPEASLARALIHAGTEVLNLCSWRPLPKVSHVISGCGGLSSDSFSLWSFVI